MKNTNDAPPPTPPQWLTVAAVGQELDVTRPTVDTWIASGELPHYRLGPRIIRIKRADLEEFLERRRHIRSRCSAPDPQAPDGEGEVEAA